MNFCFTHIHCRSAASSCGAGAGCVCPDGASVITALRVPRDFHTYSTWVVEGPPSGLGKPAAFSEDLPASRSSPNSHWNVHFQFSHENQTCTFQQKLGLLLAAKRPAKGGCGPAHPIGGPLTTQVHVKVPEYSWHCDCCDAVGTPKTRQPLWGNSQGEWLSFCSQWWVVWPTLWELLL